ncbi:hypothetical protein [Pseudomonas sp. MF6754]|uniref:hypothetical protein n=1 Tax=Pseudomonas sp. MF6754 TaxID=2797529 RepID=UPI00190D3921|nr:hypothetical protein [Pseudomonas sp. MF6754]MBK3455168.1 hypothetical protein [Pseudomonas sp. MF6754]
MNLRYMVFVCSIGMLAANVAYAAPKVLQGGSLICATEEAFDSQMQYLAQDVKEFAPGCGASNKDYKVVILDLNILSATKVQVIENGLTLWVNHESLSK